MSDTQQTQQLRESAINKCLDRLTKLTGEDFHGYRSEVWSAVSIAINEASQPCEDESSLRASTADPSTSGGLSGDYPAWRPIETAPKDGTEVIIALWDDGKPNILRRYAVARYLTPSEQWFGEPETTDVDPYWPPTHWMPLPPNPEDCAPPTPEIEPNVSADSVDEALPESENEAAEAFEHIYLLVSPHSPPWSSTYGYREAIGDIASRIQSYAESHTEAAVEKAVKPFAEVIAQNWQGYSPERWDYCIFCGCTQDVGIVPHTPDCIVPKALAALTKEVEG